MRRCGSMDDEAVELDAELARAERNLNIVCEERDKAKAQLKKRGLETLSEKSELTEAQARLKAIDEENEQLTRELKAAYVKLDESRKTVQRVAGSKRSTPSSKASSIMERLSPVEEEQEERERAKASEEAAAAVVEAAEALK